MAIESKRMQQRSGTYEQFLAHKDEFLPNEFEIVTSGDPNTPDGRAVYLSFGPDSVKRFVTKEDVQGDIAAAAKDAIAESIEIAANAAESAQNSAEQAKSYYDQIPAKVEESKQAIADYTEAIKQTIPEGYTTLSELVDELDRTRAPGIVCTTTGEQISIDNASDLKFRGLKVYGKGEQIKTTGAQLAPITESEYTGNGMTANLQEDGSLIVNGKPSGAFVTCVNIVVPNLETGSYYISGGENGAGKAIAQIYLKKPTGDLYYSNTSFQIDGQETEILFQVLSNDTSQINNHRINAILNKGSSALPIEPYTGGQPAPSPEYPQEIHKPGESGSMNVNVYGGNLFNVDKSFPFVQSGLTFDKKSDGSITVKGQSTVKCNAIFTTVTMQPGTYYISGGESFDKGLARVYLKETKKLYYNTSFTLEESTLVELQIQIDSLEAIDSVIYPMLNLGSTPLPYEPYKQLQTLTITTPNGLPGIPVESGGNYTDESRQQWISDVKDYGSGKYYQYVKEFVFDGSEDEPWTQSGTTTDQVLVCAVSNMKNNGVINGAMLCNMFTDSTKTEAGTCMVYNDGNNIRFCVNRNLYTTIDDFKAFILQKNIKILVPITPIVTDIPAEEMAAYRELHSNYPNTNIFADQTVQPGIEMNYTADTKTYVDNKIAEAVTQAITLAKAQA